MGGWAWALRGKLSLGRSVGVDSGQLSSLGLSANPLARDSCLPWAWAQPPWLGTAVFLGFGRQGPDSGQLSSLGLGAKGLTRDSCHPWVGEVQTSLGISGGLDLAPIGSRPCEFICFVGVGGGACVWSRVFAFVCCGSRVLRAFSASMCMCMCMFVFVCIGVHVHAHVYVSVCFVFVRVVGVCGFDLCKRVHVHVHACLCMHGCVCACICVWVWCVCVCVRKCACVSVGCLCTRMHRRNLVFSRIHVLVISCFEFPRSHLQECDHVRIWWCFPWVFSGCRWNATANVDSWKFCAWGASARYDDARHDAAVRAKRTGYGTSSVHGCE